jgi:regulation of enolase protein 1 (concanavalin A-like superfamily)
MRKTIFLLFAAAIFLGCASQNKTGNKAVEPAKSENSAPKPADNLRNSNGKSNSAAPGQIAAGEKVESPAEILFVPEGFPAGWRWLDVDSKYNPTKYDTKSGVLRMNVPSGKDLFGESRTAPQLLKAVTGDFEIETKVTFDPREVYQGAGLLVFRNDNNYIRLERGFGGVGGGENGVRFDKREDEVFEPVATQEKFPTDAKTVELKLRRAGKVFTAFWRLPEGEWKEVGKYESGYPETVQVGLIACNTAEEIPVEFAYIRLSPVSK